MMPDHKELEKAYQVAKENGLLNSEYHFNVKYSLAEYVRRADEDGIRMKISQNMFAYDCPDPVKPETEADGTISL